MLARRPQPGLLAARYTVLSIAKAVASLPLVDALPTSVATYLAQAKEPAAPPASPALWIYLTVAIGLVLLGGAFAGLTIALMGQDGIYLQVIKTSGDGAEKMHAASVLKLLGKGKHWVLVTLLLGNVITNETLPIVLDRSLGGGWPAVLGSTALIVIFGEIIPQSICVRYGLPIGAWCSSLVLVLMYVLSPIAWPTAKLLDRLLGEGHGTTYKKAGLKTLVTLHKTLGAAGEQLNSDEVTIISAVLDLRGKSVGSIMTPMADVFTMSADTVLDEKTMDIILSAGYSRIPIHAPDSPLNFVGMLLVKILITYDPEDCKRVRDFALATLPETAADTSCLDIINYFQEGKSHMVLVTEFPGGDTGALGVVTLEDVIEELIGEEIIDESDVFIDVHKANRRHTPAPKFRVPKGELVHWRSGTAENQNAMTEVIEENGSRLQERGQAPWGGSDDDKLKFTGSELGTSPRTTYYMRRTSSTTGHSERGLTSKQADDEIREHFKHLEPSNLASRPRHTNFKTVKIKPGGGLATSPQPKDGTTIIPGRISMAAAPHGGLGEGILPDGGQGAKDGVRALQAGYGTISRVGTENNETQDSNDQSIRPEPTREDSQVTVSTAGPLIERAPISPARSAPARSGSITENIIEAGGFKKVVLETASSSEENTSRLTAVVAESTDGAAEDGIVGDGEESAKSGKKKRRRKRKKPGSRAEAVAEAGVEAGADAEAEPEEDTPLMDGHA